MERRPPRHFIVVRTAESVRGDRSVDFAIQGFDESTAEAHPLEVGDHLAVYLGTPVSGFIATVEISGPRFVSRDRIWESRRKPGELFPVRYPAIARVVLPDDDAIQFRDLVDELEFSRYIMNRERWGPLFMRAIRSLGASDFRLIEDRLMERAASLRLNS